ncbi:PREDICTED: uncharacterized protein LOC109129576 [Camelina sativa]|uniref:Uncharacterized protein LOC109129576 n=1 Tax=Camelina sativa TaxID=90675 RepID=A0ABM1R3D1_CAMSA|nr:PREDICTED: uncharacterized protein LOC109129576 [Camelina sativa]
MSFRKVEKKSTEMGRNMSHEKSDSDSDKEGAPMMAGGYTETVNRSDDDDDWDEPVDSGKACANLTTAMETVPINRYSRKYYPNY